MTGYPVQTDAEIDNMYEAELARGWEEKCAKPEEFRTIEEIGTNIRIDAFAPLNGANFTLGLVLGNIEESMEKIRGTVQHDKLASLYDDLYNIRHDLREIEREIWRCSQNE